ncbi:uncharacterized protein LAESUDRAFT_722286 [Laetiporus sulphureus 93-53]|uniref:MYND-type domain-containing protein n=1 Tax=Laetiporus sulphureus 93-53 TaxID=1314785 RepID=A0A165GBQ9_9APHY|nr:uncharacterized protein LAESUDRAFT_722286 [Laetiporus sulphureus 93-53]KZT10123.1 hypothetical protein LAESUDRAFT_722286 [Laetiporus sulphureus 93-53]
MSYSNNSSYARHHVSTIASEIMSLYGAGSKPLPLRKEMMECYHCVKPLGKAGKLMQCGRCKWDIYCSKQCQRNAWPTHRPRCDNVAHMDDLNAERMHSLVLFKRRHLPTVTVLGPSVLEIYEMPIVTKHAALLLCLDSHPERRREVSYSVTDICLYGLDKLPGTVLHPEEVGRIRARLALADERLKATGHGGAFLAIMWCPDLGMAQVELMDYMKDKFPPLSLMPGTRAERKQLLMDVINSDQVF